MNGEPMRKRNTIMRAVARTQHAWSNHIKQTALAEGIPYSYRPVIMFLNRNPGAGQRDIAEFEDVTASAVNQTVKTWWRMGIFAKRRTLLINAMSNFI